MTDIIEGKFYEILRRIYKHVIVAFALFTIIPILIFSLLVIHLYILADLKPYEAPGLSIIAFLGLFIAFLGFFWLRSKVRAALLDLRVKLEEIAQLDPSEEKVLSRHGEIGRIATVLNKVVSELRRDKQMLKELNAELDRKVKERTAELGRLALVVESIGDSVIMTDLDHTITYVNPAACRMLGYRKEEMIDRPSPDIFGGISGNPPDLYELIRGEARRGTWEGEVLNRRKNGEIFPVYLTCFCLYDERGGCMAYVGISRDITKSKALREQMLKSEKLAALGKLVSGIAHELNNPLTGVVGYSQILLETVEDEELKQDVQKIYDEARRCDQVVQKLRAFGRGYRLKMSPLDINDLVSVAVQLKLHRIRDRGVDLEIDLCSDMPLIDGDSAQLQQAILALLDNALQALDGRGEKRLRLETSVGEGAVRVKVIDTGNGIPEDNLSRIFDPFFSTREIGEGAGLGLSLAYGAVKEHGGEITVESEFGKGSTFTVSLPLERPL